MANRAVVRLIFWLIHNSWGTVFLSALFKSMFITAQAASLWLLIGWARGALPDFVVRLHIIEDESALYPFFCSLVFIASAFFSLFSKFLCIRSVQNLEADLFFRINTDFPSSSEWRNVAKLMISIVDSVIPLLLMIIVLSAWVVIFPVLFLPILFALLILLAIPAAGVKLTKKAFNMPRKRVNKDSYLGSPEYARFYRLLINPQIITVGVYGVVAIVVSLVAYLMKTYPVEIDGIEALPLITIIAFLQMKSMIGLIVRWGVYSDCALVVHTCSMVHSK